MGVGVKEVRQAASIFATEAVDLCCILCSDTGTTKYDMRLVRRVRGCAVDYFGALAATPRTDEEVNVRGGGVGVGGSGNVSQLVLDWELMEARSPSSIASEVVEYVGAAAAA